MARTLSNTFRSALYAQETDTVFLVLIEITHDDLAAPIRVSSDATDTISNAETFSAFPFVISLPSDDNSGASVGEISFDNVSREIIDDIRTIQTPPDFSIKIVTAADPDTVEIEYSNLILENVQYDAFQIRGQISVFSLEAEPYPGDSFLPSYFGGLF
jgi:hypothetical protein